MPDDTFECKFCGHEFETRVDRGVHYRRDHWPEYVTY